MLSDLFPASAVPVRPVLHPSNASAASLVAVSPSPSPAAPPPRAAASSFLSSASHSSSGPAPISASGLSTTSSSPLSALSANVDKIASKLAASVFLSRHSASYSKVGSGGSRPLPPSSFSGRIPAARPPVTASNGGRSGGSHLAAAARAMRDTARSAVAAASSSASAVPATLSSDAILPLPAGLYQLQSVPSAVSSSAASSQKLHHVIKFVSSALPNFAAASLRLTRPTTAARRANRLPPHIGKKKGKKHTAAQHDDKAQQSEASDDVRAGQHPASGTVDGSNILGSDALTSLSLVTSSSPSQAAADSDEWRLDDVKARRSYTGQAELSGGGAADSGSSYVLLYSRDSSRQPFTIHPCDFVVMREQANYHVLSLEEAEQRMKQRAKRFDKKMNALPTLARLEGERQMEQRLQDASGSDAAAGGGGGGGGEGGLPGTTGDDGQQGVQIRRKVAVGASAEDDELGGRDDTAGAAAAAGEDEAEDDDVFNSAGGAGRGRGRKSGKVGKRDKEAGIDYRDEFDDDDETHEDRNALADGNEHDEDEQMNVDEPTIESEDEEENEATKKRTEELIKQAEDDISKASSSHAEADKDKAKKAKKNSSMDSDSDGDGAELKEEEELDSSDADDSDNGMEDEDEDDVDDSELDISSDEEEVHDSSNNNTNNSAAAVSSPPPRAAATPLAAAATPVPSASSVRSSDARERKRSRASSEAESEAANDGVAAVGEAANKKVKASLPTSAIPTSTAAAAPTSGGGAELDDSLVRSAFASHPRATIQELTKRLTKATYPQPIDKAKLIAILKRVCELDPTTKQLTLKQTVALAAPTEARAIAAIATAGGGASSGG